MSNLTQQFDRSEEFDRNWCGPEELKPRVYRSQMEKDIWHSIAVENEYRLGVLGANDVVIDIGAHIGAFSHLAYRMGSRSVYAFEIDPWHFEAAKENLSGFSDGVVVYLAAVVRGDQHRLPQYKYAGAWNPFAAVGKNVESISLDEILEPHKEVAFLKIDAEGSEFPVLYTCSQLSKVRQIAGEYHLGSHITLRDLPQSERSTASPELKELPREVSAEALASYLYEQGFEVRLEPHEPTIGLFFAKRR